MNYFYKKYDILFVDTPKILTLKTEFYHISSIYHYLDFI